MPEADEGEKPPPQTPLAVAFDVAEEWQDRALAAEAEVERLKARLRVVADMAAE